MSRCSFCESPVSRKQGVFCSGPCKNIFHNECVNVPVELNSFLNAVAGLFWKCTNCRGVEPKIDSRKLIDVIDKHCNDMFQEFNNKFEAMKTEFIAASVKDIPKTCTSSTSSPSDCKLSYAQTTKSVQKIILKPKKTNQTCTNTKSDLLQAINPIDTNITINKVKQTRDGGIVLGCAKPEEFSLLKDMAEEKLSATYDVHVLKSAHPQIRIVGMCNQYSDNELKTYLTKQNPYIFSDNSDVSIVRTWSTRKNKKIYQALLRVDLRTFNAALSRKHVIVCFDSCSVFEAFDIPRCFNCNGFFHTKKNCRNKTSCPLCSEEHEVKNCPANSNLKCVNCEQLKQAQKVDLITEHAAWDHDNCFAYKKALGKFKSDLLGAPGK